jgi:hypothetical protein
LTLSVLNQSLPNHAATASCFEKQSYRLPCGILKSIHSLAMSRLSGQTTGRTVRQRTYDETCLQVVWTLDEINIDPGSIGE